MSWFEVSLCVFGSIAIVFVMRMAMWSTRMQREARQRERQWVIEAARRYQQYEEEEQRYVDWLYRQAYGPPRLTVVQGGKAEECAVIPFRKPESD